MAINNKVVLEQSKKAGCYCCCKIFDSCDVKNFTDNGNTGVCPHCLADCLIGDFSITLEESILKKAKQFWFGG
jgi:hypothetical protein